MKFLGIWVTCWIALFATVGYAQHSTHYTVAPEDSSFPDESEFYPLSGSVINLGQKEGAIWVRVDFANGNSAHVVRFEYPSLTDGELYLERDESSDALGMPSLPQERFLTFQIPKYTQKAWFRIIPEKDAFLPVRVYTESEFQQHERQQQLINGFYYGFAAMVILGNVLMFITFGGRTFLYYSLFQLSITVSIIYTDGYFNLTSVSDWWKQYAEALLHLSAGWCCLFFISHFLTLKEHLLTFYKVSVGLMIACTSTVGVFLFSNNGYAFIASEAFILCTYTVYLCTAIMLYKKQVYAKYVLLAYGVLVPFTYLFFLSPQLGWQGLEVNGLLIKAGGIGEMLILTFAVTYRMRTIQEENEQMRQDLLSYSESSLHSGQDEITHVLLTPREKEVLEFLQAGLTNKEISKELSVSVNTVKYHIKNVYNKLDIRSRKEAVNL